MKPILSLIGNPALRSVTAAVVARAREALREAGAEPGPTHTLDAECAVDLPFAGSEPPAHYADAVRGALADTAIDINALAGAGRRKRLLIADMDSTIIQCECIDELADAVGLKPQIAAITEQAMRGALAFEPALRARVALLKGLPEATLETVYKSRVRLTPGARTLVHTMKAHGARAVLVSGGFTFFTSRVARAAGFDRERANRLEIAEGALTGVVAEPILGRDAKRETLLEEVAALGLAAQDALAVGDGANDLAMIETAGLGVAFRAKPIVAAAAGARIEHGDLTALLYLQGYARTSFAEP